MKTKKRFLSILLSLALVLGLMPGMSLMALATSPAYLTFTGTDSFTIATNNESKNWGGMLEYSTNASSWTEWDGTAISSDNNVLYLRGTGNSKISGDYNKQWNIVTSGTVACGGDIRTLLNYENPEAANMEEFCFAYLFYGCASLTTAPALPATALAGRYMRRELLILFAQEDSHAE